jgi:phosphate transport system substrate-binding protein
MNKLTVIALGMMAAILIALSAPNWACAADTSCSVRIASCYDASNRLEVWCKGFMDEHPKYLLTVSGTTSGEAIKALLDKKANLCLAARKMSSAEKESARIGGIKLQERLLLHDGIAFITHPRLGISELTYDQIRAIYGGKLTNWSQLAGPNVPVIAYTLDAQHSSVGAILREELFKDTPMSSQARVVRRSKNVIENVSRTEGAIGYTSHLYLIDDRGTDPRVVKVIKIRQREGVPAVGPSEETIKNRTYPVTAPLYFYWDDNPASHCTREFVEFCGLGLL